MMSECFNAGGKLFCSYCGNEMIRFRCSCNNAKKDVEVQNTILTNQETLGYIKRKILPSESIRKIQIKEDIKSLQNELETL